MLCCDRSLESLPHREAKSGAVSPPRHAQRLQHQRPGQPDGDPGATAHAPLLEDGLPEV